MTVRSIIRRLSAWEALNFTLSNRLPRRLATRFAGWFSRIEQPFVRDLSIRIWALFSELDLRDAKKEKFTSLRDCFIRELKDGARPIDADPALLISPCDAIVGASGAIAGADLLQVKGSGYPLVELLRDEELAHFYRGGCYVTLRLTAAMYHHFHAPHDLQVEQITHVWGDAWNVNPAALARVPRLYCRNERAILRTRLAATGHVLTLVPVAAILVAGIRLRLSGRVVDPRRAAAPMISMPVAFEKGEEMGWFEHGSTIIVLAPRGLRLAAGVQTSKAIRMGEALLQLGEIDRKPEPPPAIHPRR